MKKIAVLGCTGSIGTTTLKIVRHFPDQFQIVLLANGHNEKKLSELSAEFSCPIRYCAETAEDKDFLHRAETYENIDITVNGIAGFDGLLPSLAVLKAGKILATANKESLVCAGNLIRKVVEQTGAKIYPIDSEHSAVWQCMQGKDKPKKIILTASGGAFRTLSKEELSKAKGKDALKHPNWKMGQKVTVDCATLMNKGMELIEAKHLFHTQNIEAVLHPESIVHALVETEDNGFLCVLSTPDMTLPIQYALFYPHRETCSVAPLDIAKLGALHFSSLDEDRFPCYTLCKEIMPKGDIAGTVLNAADEILVHLYLQDRCAFYDIPKGVEEALHLFGQDGSFDNTSDLCRMDRAVKEYILKTFGK